MPGPTHNSVPRVCIVHPGTQHSFRLAEEFNRQSMLARFVTSLYVSPKAVAILESPPIGFVGRQLLRRWANRRRDALAGKVVTWPWPELAYLACSRLSVGRASDWVAWRNRRFGQWVCRHGLDDVDVVWSFETSSLEVFAAARRRGIRCVLSITTPFPTTTDRIIREQKAKRPEYSSALQDFSTREQEICRRQKEIEAADMIVVSSQFSARSLGDQHEIQRKTIIVPHGVGLERFTPAAERRTLARPIFLYLSWFRHTKGIYYALEAWHAARLGTEAEFRLAGGERKQLSLWQDDLPDGVCILGRVAKPDLPDVYRHADVFVFPSLFEGFGLVLLEAMASGLPVITTYNTAGPDLIEHGKEGFLLEAGDVDGLAQAMRWFVEHPERIPEMGRAARQRAEQFTWDAYGNRCAEICRKVIAMHAGSSTPNAGEVLRPSRAP